MIEKIKAWFAQNKLLGIAAASLLGLFLLRKMSAPARRRRRSRVVSAPRKRRKSVKRQYKTGGAAKKAWQVKGSIAARRHMAKLRKMRG